MARYRATVAYDGTAYLGFQRQAGDAPTIQAALEKAIAETVRAPVTVLAAGRTDTGVHATGQVIAFDAVWKHRDAALLKAVNAALPEDIVLQDLVQTREDFHPRFDARTRVYTYTVLQAEVRDPLLRYRAWQIRGLLDEDAMRRAGRLIIGAHDFAAFGSPPQGESTLRVVYRSEWRTAPRERGVIWTYTIEANAFLQHMVRRIVGLLVDVGLGRRTVDEFERLFRSARLAKAVRLAPPQGLVLERVTYPE